MPEQHLFRSRNLAMAEKIKQTRHRPSSIDRIKKDPFGPRQKCDCLALRSPNDSVPFTNVVLIQIKSGFPEVACYAQTIRYPPCQFRQQLPVRHPRLVLLVDADPGNFPPEPCHQGSNYEPGMRPTRTGSKDDPVERNTQRPGLLPKLHHGRSKKIAGG